MRPNNELLALASGLAVLLAIVRPVAQGPAQPAVNLGYAIGTPGKTVALPLALEGVGERTIRRVVARVRVPAELSFVRLEKAGMLDEDGALEATAVVKDPAPPVAPPPGSPTTPPTSQPPAPAGAHVVEVRITSRDAGLSDGTIAYLVFRLAAGTTVEKTPEVPLEVEGTLFERAEGGEPVAVATAATKVLVESLDAPISACFFYMH